MLALYAQTPSTWIYRRSWGLGCTSLRGVPKKQEASVYPRTKSQSSIPIPGVPRAHSYCRKGLHALLGARCPLIVC